MNPITIILSEIIYRPIFNLLIVFLFIFNGNLGLAIIALTIAVKLILLKPTLMGNDMQKHMTNLQPKMQEIQEKYKNDPQKQSEETLKILKTQGAGPLKGCLMMLIQIPIFIGLFFVIKDFATGHTANLVNDIYSFLSYFGIKYISIENINHYLFGIDMFKNNNIIFTVLSAILMYAQIKLTMLNKPATPNIPGTPNMPDMTKMMDFMNIFLIGSMAVFVFQMPAGIGLYIVVSTLFSVIQYMIQYREYLKIKVRTLFQKK